MRRTIKCRINKGDRPSMLMQKATPEMLSEWKKTWSEHKDKLRPNRKTGQEMIDFLCSRYPLTELHGDGALNVIVGNVLDNKPYKEKLPPHKKPIPRAFVVENACLGQMLYKDQDVVFKGTDIFVGVDLASGFFCVEGSSFLWDELCAYQGLDEKDLQNYYCVAQYIACLERFGALKNNLLENDCLFRQSCSQ